MDFTRVAPYLTDPYVLAGFLIFLAAGFCRLLIVNGVIPRLTEGAGSQVVKLILILGFILSFLLVVVGAIYKFKELEYSRESTSKLKSEEALASAPVPDLASIVKIDTKKFEFRYPAFNELWNESVTVNVEIHYPEIRGLPNKQVERKINDQIIEWAGINAEHVNENLDHVGNYQLINLKNNMLSLLMEDGGIYVGAATSVTAVKTLVLNLQNGERFELKDLFRSGYQKPLLSLVKTRAYCDAEKIQMGEPEEINDNQEFYVKNSVLTLVYQRRDICAGMYGPTYVSIEAGALKHLLNPNGPLGYML